jgi:hypothetical protein
MFVIWPSDDINHESRLKRLLVLKPRLGTEPFQSLTSPCSQEILFFGISSDQITR